MEKYRKDLPSVASELVLEIGGEGGSLCLYGRASPDGWSFSRASSEHALVAMLKEDGEWSKKDDARRKDDLWRYEEECFDSLEYALGMLDKEYPGWTLLYPLRVHPAFREAIFDALHYRARFYGQFVDWWQWGSVLSPEQDYSRQLKTIHFGETLLWLDFADGRVLGVPLRWLSSLLKASPEQRGRYELSPVGIHWVAPVENLSIARLLAGRYGNGQDEA